MNRIETIFESLRAEGRTALMPFITGGYPSLPVTREVLCGLEGAGASIVEIGFPFSDPIADGPVIAGSMHEALTHGVTPDDLFDLVASVRSETSLGLVAMVSQSIVRRMGPERFLDTAATTGFDGLIVPDLDVEQAGELREAADARGICLSLLISHLSTPERRARIIDQCRGFVYVLARAGITGESELAPDVAALVESLRPLTPLPLAVGFGISTAEHVTAVTQFADAAIVGSALVRRMGRSDDPAADAVGFVTELARGLANHPPLKL